MELFIVPGNIYKLDVGTMLGNAPKVLWERGMPADEKNRIRMAIRPLLAITQNATILFEGGIGAFWSLASVSVTVWMNLSVWF